MRSADRLTSTRFGSLDLEARDEASLAEKIHREDRFNRGINSDVGPRGDRRPYASSDCGVGVGLDFDFRAGIEANPSVAIVGGRVRGQYRTCVAG